MKTKTAALIAVPAVAAVILGGGVAAAATHQPQQDGTHQQTRQVQVWQHCESGWGYGYQGSGARANTGSNTAYDRCYSGGTVTSTVRSFAPASVKVTHPVTHHVSVTHTTTASHHATGSHSTWRADRHNSGDSHHYGDRDGDCN